MQSGRASKAGAGGRGSRPSWAALSRLLLPERKLDLLDILESQGLSRLKVSERKLDILDILESQASSQKAQS